MSERTQEHEELRQAAWEVGNKIFLAGAAIRSIASIVDEYEQEVGTENVHDLLMGAQLIGDHLKEMSRLLTGPTFPDDVGTEAGTPGGDLSNGVATGEGGQ